MFQNIWFGLSKLYQEKLRSNIIVDISQFISPGCLSGEKKMIKGIYGL